MKVIQRIFLFLTLVFSSITYCAAQDTWKFSTGLGLPELAHFGVSYQYSQAEFGLRFGTLPLKNEDIYQYSAEFLYHFAGEAKTGKQKPWFGKLGAMSFRDETEKEIHKYTYLNAKVGHDFLIDEHWGISVDAGIFYELSNQEIKKTSSNSWFNLDFDFHILPSIGVQVFYTL
jgi:hypothetical protein